MTDYNTIRTRTLTKRERLHSVMGQTGDSTHIATIGPDGYRAMRGFGTDAATAKADLLAKLAFNSLDAAPFVYSHAGHTIFVYRNYESWDYRIVRPDDNGTDGCIHSMGGTRDEAIRGARLHLAQMLFNGTEDGMTVLATDEQRREHLSWVCFQDAWVMLRDQGALDDALDGEAHRMAGELRSWLWKDYETVYAND